MSTQALILEPQSVLIHINLTGVVLLSKTMLRLGLCFNLAWLL